LFPFRNRIPRQKKIMHCVIGSGPAGVACARALLARGANVLLLDAGLDLEPDRAQVVRQLAATKPSAWPAGQIARLKEGMVAGAKGVPLKFVFGSDYPYRETETQTPWQGHGVGIRPSLALGGLSTVWGAAMLPYRDADIADWPIKITDLEKHYRAAAEIAGLSGQRDDLEELFPLHCDHPSAIQPSRQAELLLRNLQRHRAGLLERGWHFGRARVAIRAADTAKGIGCIRCGFCLYGCPYGCIYNSADTVQELRAEKNFTYQRDVIVTTLREDSGQVIVRGHQRQTREPLSFEVNRVYLAAGVIPTAQILLRSQSAYDQPVRLQDSQYFLFPIVLARRTRDVQTEPLYTLSQLFIELCNPQISRHTVHMQLYTYSEMIGQAVRKTFGPLAGPLDRLARQLEERLLIVQGFVHSDESPSMSLTLKSTGANGGDCLQVTVRPNPQGRRVVKRVLREMLRQTRRLGGVALLPMLQMEEPGRSFHSGGSFPMREKPGAFESDCLGRPHGWNRVHAVDATVLPSVPATTITFSVMANAHRIGWESAALD
jgi:choline dehydrogenase-like flavoprotein